MAAIQNLEVVVEVNIGKAITALSDLQDELQDLAEDIERVDARGSEGIDINTNLDDLDTELAAVRGKMEAFEKANSLDIDTNTNGFNFDGGDFAATMFGDMPEGSRTGRFTSLYDDMFDDFADADLDFGDFNAERGRGINRRDDNVTRLGFLKKLRKSTSGTIDKIDDFGLRMSDMHNLLASIIPVLVVFIGAIPAAYTALFTLAGAALAAAAGLAVLTGLGAMGVAMQGGEFDAERLMEELRSVRDAFLEAFAPLAERLEPLFRDGLSGLERFFQAIANQGDALMALTDEARAFGGFIMDFVPGALRTLGALVEAMAPIFADIGSYLEGNFTNIVRTMVRLTNEIVPVLASMADKIGNALPAIVRMSVGFMKVASVIIDVLGGFGRLLGMLGISPQMFGLVIASILSLYTALSFASMAIKTFAASAVGSAIQAMWSWWYVTIFQKSTLMSGLVKALASAIVSIYGYITSLVGASAASLSMATATMIAAGALAAFLTLASLGVLAGLSAVAMGVASNFLGVADSIDQATKSMKDFNRVSGKTDGGSFNPYGGEGGGPNGGGGSSYTGSTSGGSGTTNVNIESSGDRQKDKSNGQYAFWVAGRTTGSGA